MAASTNRLAIVQPYFLPYIGYIQLLAAVDRFVVFDDVNFINRGWINRNRLLLQGHPHIFTVPLLGASQNKLICELEICNDFDWRQKFLKTVRQSYSKAPTYANVSALLERIIYYPSVRLDEFLLNSLREVTNYLSLDVDIVGTSRNYRNSHLKGEARILDICRLENAQEYINPIGGLELYDKANFSASGVKLRFLQSTPIRYDQGLSNHVPWLSIIDVLMFNSPTAVQNLLTEKVFV